MSIKSMHPLYMAMLDKWTLGRHSYEGEDTIKSAGTTYLPPTSGQVMDGQGSAGTLGQKAYEAYKLRAVYPDIYREAVEAAIGIMHREKPKIDLPASMEAMRDDCTLLGESLEMLLRKINAQQLTTGRLGMLGDIRKDRGVVRPIIVTYKELSIRNWDDTSINDEDVDIRLVVLDESGHEMGPDFDWKFVTKYRLLSLSDNPEGLITASGTYGSSVLKEGDELASATLKIPNYMGNVLDEIPFVFINSKDLSPNPDAPPLEGLAKLCLTIYRGEADYRQHLFMQSQDTLVRIGAHGDEDDDVRTGAGARIDVPIGGDAKYIGVASQGLAEQRTALENDYQRAIQKSGQLLDATSRAKESGDALRIRVAAQTATLPQIAKTGAAALQKILRILARWQGADPEQVIVTPNLNFTDADLNGQTLVQIMQAKGLGAPYSTESIHEWMEDQGFTSLTYTEEVERLLTEDPVPGGGIPSPVDLPDPAPTPVPVNANANS